MKVMTLPRYDEVEKYLEVLNWARKNCPSFVTTEIHGATVVSFRSVDYSKVDYYFTDEKDAILFSLRWS